MPRSRALRKLSLTLANLLLPIAVLVFATGFFPYKPVLPGLATWDEEGEELGLGSGSNAPFDRVIFMVVDALRSDFVYGHGSGMGFAQSLIRSGAAIPFTAHATPPTVTMPRVKALTTGSVPSFLDLILNFAESDTSSSLALQDTWLAQIREMSFSTSSSGSSTDAVNTSAKPAGQLVFYGDDTWLKLFPSDWFARHDGTSSFFVSDFTEVDNNVTRHIPSELERDDWNAMIMHYLGLDHIGHKTGPQGPNMLPKQKEMDGIVRDIYRAIEDKDHLRNTLLVLAGDHGMNAGGNHGGSGPGETEPALLFASPKFKGMRKSKIYEAPTIPKEGTEFHYYTKVEQSDLVPTLAGLMGYPVPKNSLGVFIPELVGALGGKKEEVEVLRRNARQMTGIVEATYGQEKFAAATERHEKNRAITACEGLSEGEQHLACMLSRTKLGHGHMGEDIDLMRYMYAVQETLSSTASSYDIPRMVGGILVAGVSLLFSAMAFSQLWPPSLAGTFLAVLSLLYGIMMFASSYVEEEQHFWYWLTPAWLVLLAIKEVRQKPGKIALSNGLNVSRAALLVPILAIHRLMLRWNQTGQKHAGEPDVVHSFFPEHHSLLWLLILATYTYVGFGISSKSFKGIMNGEAAVSTAVAMILPAVVFKLNFTQADAPELVRGLGEGVRNFTTGLDLVVQARVVFVMLAISTGIVMVGGWLMGPPGEGKRRFGRTNHTLADRLHPLLTLFLLTQTRAPNVPLFLLLECQRELLSTLQDSTNSWTALTSAVTSLLFSQTTYFAFGGSNSISSIDLSNAYNGVADYNIVAVGILLFASNWAGAVWWCSAAVTLLAYRGDARSASLASRKAPRKDAAVAERPWVEEERARLLDEVMGPAKPASAPAPISKGEQEAWFTHVAAMSVFIAGSLLAVMAACTALRTHLFIWTVFSPKYLYTMAWAVGWHLGINVGLGNLLWWLGGMA